MDVGFEPDRRNFARNSMGDWPKTRLSMRLETDVVSDLADAATRIQEYLSFGMIGVVSHAFRMTPVCWMISACDCKQTARVSSAIFA